MYSEEIEAFLKERDYCIGGDDLLKVISIKENPQLTRISYSAKDNKYYMLDDKNNEFEFEAMPYQTAIEKGLVKVKSRK